jgi:KaiC/GvpD/RAD55 family RecA-like ATPase
MTAVNAHKDGAMMLVNHSSQDYLESTARAIKALTDGGYCGVYISFQRPYSNIYKYLKSYGADVDKIAFIDAATSLANEKEVKADNCIHISADLNIDELVRAVYTSVEKLSGKNKFIYMDSLSTITLYKPLSEVMRFSEFMERIVQKHEIQLAAFGVAEDFSNKKFVKDIALRADEVIAASSS